MFNLEDGEDGNEEGLTHFGQSLGDMERFDDVQLSSEEEEEEGILRFPKWEYLSCLIMIQKMLEKLILVVF